VKSRVLSHIGTRHLRVIDESGEDNLDPTERFVPVDLPTATRRAVLEVA
jgi:hypothetical protein